MRENEFIAIVNRNNQRLYLISLSYTKNSTDTEDIMQNVFMKLWKHSKPFEDDIHIDKWLTIDESRELYQKSFHKAKCADRGSNKYICNG